MGLATVAPGSGLSCPVVAMRPKVRTARAVARAAAAVPLRQGAAAAAAARRGVFVIGRAHLPATQRAGGDSGGVQALPDAVEPLLERKPAAVGAPVPLAPHALERKPVVSLALERQRQLAARALRNRAHETLLHTPTTL